MAPSPRRARVARKKSPKEPVEILAQKPIGQDQFGGKNHERGLPTWQCSDRAIQLPHQALRKNSRRGIWFIGIQGMQPIGERRNGMKDK